MLNEALFKTELLTRLRFFLEESETGTRAQARGLTLPQGPTGKTGQVVLRCACRQVRTCLSAACQWGHQGEWGSDDE